MASLKYVGKKPPTTNPDLVYRDYVTFVKGNDVSAGEVDTAITNALTGYVDRTYVDAQDDLLATKAYVDAQDALRMQKASKGIPNGVAPLNAQGKIPVERINSSPTNQRWNRGPWSPASYGSTNSTITAETTLFTTGVTDPGYPYRLVVWGEIDQRNDYDLDSTRVLVRVGNATTGQIVGYGRGANDAQDVSLSNGDDFERPNANNLGPGWEQVYNSQPDGSGDDNGSGGRLEISNGRAVWNTDFRVRACHCRAVSPAFQYTGTDRQRIYAQVEANGDPEFAGQGPPMWRLYARVADDWSSYVALQGYNGGYACRLMYKTPTSGGEQTLTTAPLGMVSNSDALVLTAGEYDTNIRRFKFYRNGSVVLDYTDTSGLTNFGPNNRGWGFMMRTGQANLGATRPPYFDSIWANDAVRNYSPAIIVPQAIDSMTPLTGPTTLYVRALRSGSTGVSTYNAYKPKLHVMAIPA